MRLDPGEVIFAKRKLLSLVSENRWVYLAYNITSYSVIMSKLVLTKMFEEMPQYCTQKLKASQQNNILQARK